MQQSPLPAEELAQGIRDVITTYVLPGTTIKTIALLPDREPHRVYEVGLSDASTALAVMPPHPMTRLLRYEKTMSTAEATVVHWLGEAAQNLTVRKSPSPASSRLPSLSSSRQSHEEDILAGENLFSTGGASPADLMAFIPTPISPSSPLSTSLDTKRAAPPPFLSLSIFIQPAGVPISTLSVPLSPGERMAVDYQAGKLVRRLSCLTPKSGKFGPAPAVLAPTPTKNAPGTDGAGAGMGSWSVAFHSILESILRDGEDVAVALAYPTIRRHFRRLSHILDTVVSPCLVLVDLSDDTNLLVERLSKSKAPEDTLSISTSRKGSPPTANGADSAPSSPPEGINSTDVIVTGVRDWSHCLFGDPLFASAFCNEPSEPFLLGFSDGATTSECSRPYREAWVSVESKENRTARLLLYQCYHAVVQIVKGFYRPGLDQTTRELAARKRLTEILTKLDTFPEDCRLGLQHRRPSGEISPAKKLKPSPGNDGRS